MVVTAGPVRGFSWQKALQAEPAKASRHGRIENLAEAIFLNLPDQGDL